MSLVASASPYGGAFGGEGAGSRSTVGHMTPSPVSLADNGSSAYAPFGDLLAPAGGMGAPAQDAAHSYARQGLTEVEDELDQSFRDQIFDSLKEGFLKVRTAVADRNK